MENRTRSDLFHFTIGEGPPLLLMHGGLGFDHTLFRPFLDPLSDRFTLVFYDQRGNGRSRIPRDYSRLTHESLIDDAEGLRKLLGFQRWAVLGHSYGGALALEYARLRPDSLDGVVVCAATPSYQHFDDALILARKKATEAEFETLLRALTSPPSSDDELGETMRSIWPVYAHGGSHDLYLPVFGDVKFNVRAYLRSAQLLPGFDIRPHLPDIRVRTLVISGRHDWLAPPHLGPDDIVARMPFAEGVVFEHSAHYPYAEQEEDFRDHIVRWHRSIS